MQTMGSNKTHRIAVSSDRRHGLNSFPKRTPDGYPSWTEISSKHASVPPMRHGLNSFPKRAHGRFPSWTEISSKRPSVLSGPKY